MEEGKKIEKKDNKNLMCIVVILCLLVLGLVGCIVYDKAPGIDKNDVEDKEYNSNNENIKEDNSEINNNDETTKENENIINNINIDFDFNEMENTLKTNINDEKITSFVQKCIDKGTEETGPSADYENIEVSNNTIDIILNKLKTAKSIDNEITYSWLGCPPKSITYYISVNSTNVETVHSQRVFSLNYANGNDMLLVGYNNKGYAFHFYSSEDINYFIESLK